jgi:hypothetical protein
VTRSRPEAALGRLAGIAAPMNVTPILYVYSSACFSPTSSIAAFRVLTPGGRRDSRLASGERPAARRVGLPPDSASPAW